jgi:hypothetical protein
MKNVFVFTKTNRNEIADQQVRTEADAAAKLFHKEAKKNGIRLFGGELFCEAGDLAQGKEFAAGDLEPTGVRIHVRRCSMG